MSKLLVLVVSALALFGVAACGDSGRSSVAGSSSPAGSDHEQALRFARCMRAHGVDMPDPGSDGVRQAVGVPVGDDAAQ